MQPHSKLYIFPNLYINRQYIFKLHYFIYIQEGYDLELNRIICRELSIPVIASGGCGKPIHMLEVFQKTNVDAALAASIFHYEKSTVKKVKQFLKRNNIHVRI